ncbi:HAMP domain-containing sensor histidine kinase [Desulfobacula sp.]|uniref:HAMP domain-containing sensor histidine kinase n=1 Tax=Desulfobacula sp. TaxID=2593537 RepID=UPI00262521A5|nr:HAMP domain-containing sensor histidine kinase [Desulfobacula sp.]
MKLNMKCILFYLLLAVVAGIGVLHALTPGYMIFYHDTYRRLSYFPIAIGAILYGLRGGICLAVLSCLAFVPHLYMFWAAGPQAYFSELSEIVFYLAAGIVIGLISSRETKLREKYKTLSEKLTGSYQRLHEQASQLLEAEKQLGQSQMLSMLGHVSASLAHEIKNPLASIKGAAEILADEVSEDHPKHEFINIMRSEISRLNHSVNDVLEYCRGHHHNDSGRQESVGTIIRRVVSLLDARIKEKAIQVSVNPATSGNRFLTDEAAMIQVLMNIIINAIDAVEKNGRIIIDFCQHENGGLIQISDDGPGIDENLVQEVFQSFVTFKENGTGLGLSISKRVVERLGGTITIDRATLGGARFSIFLPETPFSNNESIQHV